MGALLRGTKREQVKRGQVIAAPGSIKAVNQFKAQVYVRGSPDRYSYIKRLLSVLFRSSPRMRVRFSLKLAIAVIDTPLSFHIQAAATRHSSKTTAPSSSSAQQT